MPVIVTEPAIYNTEGMLIVTKEFPLNENPFIKYRTTGRLSVVNNGIVKEKLN